MLSDKYHQTNPASITNLSPPPNSTTNPDTLIPTTDASRTTRKKKGEEVSNVRIKNKPQRKNTIRACVQCQKSHATCGNERPCKRCMNRGLSAQCTDGERKVKYLLESPKSVPNTTTIIDPSEYNEKLSVQISQPTPASTPAPIPVLDNDDSIVTNSSYMVEPFLMDYGFFSETANLEYDVLNSMLSNNMILDSGAYQGFPDFPLAETCPPPLNNLPPHTTTISSDTWPRINSEGASGTSSDTWPQINSEGTSGTSSNNLKLSTLLGKKDLAWQRAPEQIASSYSEATSAFCYTKSYHFLLKYIIEKLSKDNVLKICRAISQFRPSFISLFMNLTEEDLIFVEKSFQRSLLELEKLIGLSGTPTVVWRRSGDIVLVGREFTILTHWSPEELLGKPTYIYELMDENSCVSYWEKYSTCAFDNSKSSVRTTCHIYDSQKRLISCAFCFAIKRDIFDIPSMIVGSVSLILWPLTLHFSDLCF